MTLALALAMLSFFLLQNSSLAFQLSSRHRFPSKNLPLTCSTQSKANQEDHDVSGAIVLNNEAVSRRLMLSNGLASTLSLLAIVPTAPAYAVTGGAAQSAARVESWPGIESLEPLYEFKLSVDAVVAGVQDSNNWPFIQKRLDGFFRGFIINEKNYFMGVGLQYMNDIQYDKNELPNYVVLDKEARFEALENTMKNLESLKTVLANSSGSDNADAVEALARSSQSSLEIFFAMIPEQDVKAVEELFVHVKKADINGDGRLSDEEIIYLSPMEQEVWKRRVQKF
eukprot:CAMPEP_0183726914 /NCGR_PEP_ID=MMETSP0737-20130205/24395_1 /TAXON_ID=385413 /ORGANISM="Thalassiosira miniscula, Strain CCMP1093" /LENGTH=282 /DNA_ID=CAMNT_0025958385 /DNA_START=76 /DNA_END=927 /DNA_ORIENTATION=-